jgi:L-alanine-DL-glutamate epimerase-like enolase superfamily enzyme
MSLDSNTAYNLFPSDFTKGKQHIPINGLVWMGDKAFMKKQLEEKLASGYSCIKLKIGAIDFETELELLQFIRNNYSSQEIEIRVDANGAFHSTAALEKLKRLAEFELHSIEQPIKQGQLHEMASLCETSPIPIALDEELIGVVSEAEKSKLISTIKPQYIILKPSLIGGFKSATDWINIAKLNNVGWWITSALESNIGLNAIAQWTATLNNNMPQGLGTGALYTNNFNSPLVAENGILRFDTNANWQVNLNF